MNGLIATISTVNAAKHDESMDPHSPSRIEWTKSANLHATAQEMWLVRANESSPGSTAHTFAEFMAQTHGEKREEAIRGVESA